MSDVYRGGPDPFELSRVPMRALYPGDVLTIGFPEMGRSVGVTSVGLDGVPYFGSRAIERPWVVDTLDITDGEPTHSIRLKGSVKVPSRRSPEALRLDHRLVLSVDGGVEALSPPVKKMSLQRPDEAGDLHRLDSNALAVDHRDLFEESEGVRAVRGVLGALAAKGFALGEQEHPEWRRRAGATLLLADSWLGTDSLMAYDAAGVIWSGARLNAARGVAQVACIGGVGHSQFAHWARAPFGRWNLAGMKRRVHGDEPFRGLAQYHPLVTYSWLSPDALDVPVTTVTFDPTTSKRLASGGAPLLSASSRIDVSIRPEGYIKPAIGGASVQDSSGREVAYPLEVQSRVTDLGSTFRDELGDEVLTVPSPKKVLDRLEELTRFSLVGSARQRASSLRDLSSVDPRGYRA